MARMTRRIISDSFQKWNQTCHQSKKQFRSKEQRMSSEEGGCHGAADVQTEIMVEHSQVWLQVESRGSLFLHQEDLWRVRERKEVCEHGERDGAQGIHLQLVHCCGDVKKEAFREHTEEGIKTSYSCNRAFFANTFSQSQIVSSSLSLFRTTMSSFETPSSSKNFVSGV